MAIITELKNKANLVANAKEVGENTAARVGGALQDAALLISELMSTAGTQGTNISNLQNSIDGLREALGNEQKARSLRDEDLNGLINVLQQQVDTLVTGNEGEEIENFNEVVAFLRGIRDNETLLDLLTEIKARVNTVENLEKTDIGQIRGEVYNIYNSKGNSNGIAPLDGNAKVPLDNLPEEAQRVVLVSFWDDTVKENDKLDEYGLRYGYNPATKKLYRSVFIPNMIIDDGGEDGEFTASRGWFWRYAVPDTDKIYLNGNDSIQYRWDGVDMIPITTKQLVINLTAEYPPAGGFYFLEDNEEQERSALHVSWKRKRKSIGVGTVLVFKSAMESWKRYQYIGKDVTEASWMNISNWILVSNYSNFSVDTYVHPMEWKELKEWRDEGSLIQGAMYRITDYVCTTTAADTRSAGHRFDILVTAVSERALSEEAYAIPSLTEEAEGKESYFSGSNLAAWKLWYCLDNDQKRFSWADPVNGKGVVYRMIDEYDNDCPYDFKNIQFKRYKIIESDIGDNRFVGQYKGFQGFYGLMDNNDAIFCYTFSGVQHDRKNGGLDYGNIFDTSLNQKYIDGRGLVNVRSICRNNKMAAINDSLTTSGGVTCSNWLNNIVFLGKYDPDPDPDPDELEQVKDNVFGPGCANLSLGGNVIGNKLEGKIALNLFGGTVTYNSFGGTVTNNSFGGTVTNNSFGGTVTNNSFGGTVTYNSFGGTVTNNSFGGYVDDASFKRSVTYNIFSGTVMNSTFDDKVSKNTFSGSLRENNFKGDLVYNSIPGTVSECDFEGNMHNCTFEGYCMNLRFPGEPGKYLQYMRQCGETLGKKKERTGVGVAIDVKYEQLLTSGKDGSVVVLAPWFDKGAETPPETPQNPAPTTPPDPEAANVPTAEGAPVSHDNEPKTEEELDK